MRVEPKKERRTVQKAKVLAALEAQTRFVSAQDLHRILVDESNTVGLATVYRQLNSLSENGGADSIMIGDQQYFRSCRQNDHHHHLVCENCGTAVEIDPPTEAWITKTAESHGFDVKRHVFEVFGLCSDCRQKARHTTEG